MEYRQYLTIDDFYDKSCNDPEKLDTKGPATEYKWKGKMNHLSPNVAQKLKSFVRWMTHEDRPYELHDDFLATLTRESYLKFRHMDTLSYSASSPSNHDPYKLKTSFSGESKHQTSSESQTALNNFKKGSKRDASVYPIFKNDKYNDKFQRSFLANLKAQGLYDVADPNHDPENDDTYEKERFKGKLSFVYSVLVTSLQIEKGRELVKEFEGDARSIILKLHHYHTKSNVAQHDILIRSAVRSATKTSPNLKLTSPTSPSMTAGRGQSDNSSATSRRNSGCLTAWFLFLITFLKLQESHFSRGLSNKTMTSDRYISWTLCGGSKLTQQMLLWDAAHQYDLHQVKKGPQRKAFFSKQEEFSDDDEYANAEEQFSTDPEPEEHSPYSVYQSSFHPKMPQKSFYLPTSGKHFLREPNI